MVFCHLATEHSFSIIMGSRINTRKHIKSETSETINWARNINNSRKCNQSVIKSADCCVKFRKKTHALSLSEILLCFFVTTPFIFSSEKLYFIIWLEISTATSLVFFHLCFAINSIVFTQRRHRAFLSPEIRFNYVTDTHKQTHTREYSFWRPVEPIKFYL